MASDMGCPAAWGDPKELSATGGSNVGSVYSAIGAQRSIGGIPCELVHGHVDQKSCVANAARRGAAAFLKAVMIYSPVSYLYRAWAWESHSDAEAAGSLPFDSSGTPEAAPQSYQAARKEHCRVTELVVSIEFRRVHLDDRVSRSHTRHRPDLPEYLTRYL
jgi:hypothetical protein